MERRTIPRSLVGETQTVRVGGPHKHLSLSLYLQVCTPGPARERDLFKVKQLVGLGVPLPEIQFFIDKLFHKRSE